MDDHPEGTLDAPEGHILIRRHLHPLFLHDVHSYIIEGLGNDTLSRNTVISRLVTSPYMRKAEMLDIRTGKPGIAGSCRALWGFRTSPGPPSEKDPK